MADYNGTDEDDIIDVSELDSDIGNLHDNIVESIEKKYDTKLRK